MRFEIFYRKNLKEIGSGGNRKYSLQAGRAYAIVEREEIFQRAGSFLPLKRQNRRTKHVKNTAGRRR